MNKNSLTAAPTLTGGWTVHLTQQNTGMSAPTHKTDPLHGRQPAAEGSEV